MKNIDAMDDATIDRLIDRYRDYLDSIDWAEPHEYVAMKDYRKYLAGKIRTPEVKLYRLTEAGDAHRVSEGRHLRGKLVFQVR